MSVNSAVVVRPAALLMLLAALLVPAAYGNPTVTATFNTVGNALSVDYSTDGGVHWYTTSAGDYLLNTGSVNIPVFCIELTQHTTSGPVTWTVDPLASGPSSGAMTTTKANELLDLYGTFFPNFAAALSPSVTKAVVEAIQIATWEIVAETTFPKPGLAVDSGNIQFRNLSTDVANDVNTYLSAINTGKYNGNNLVRATNVSALDNCYYQDYAYQTPEPGFLAAWGLLALGIGYRVRRAR